MVQDQPHVIENDFTVLKELQRKVKLLALSTTIFPVAAISQKYLTSYGKDPTAEICGWMCRCRWIWLLLRTRAILVFVLFRFNDSPCYSSTRPVLHGGQHSRNGTHVEPAVVIDKK
jgi:hypothetical protein